MTATDALSDIEREIPPPSPPEGSTIDRLATRIADSSSMF
jgi:hypothetical protein